MKTHITKQVITNYTIKNGKYLIGMTIDKFTNEYGLLKIKPYLSNDFLFQNKLTENTLDKWETVAKLILEAIKVARKELEK